MSTPIKQTLTAREARLVDQLISLYNGRETELVEYLSVLAEIAAGRKLIKDLEADHARPKQPK